MCACLYAIYKIVIKHADQVQINFRNLLFMMTTAHTIFFTLCNTYLQSTSHVNRLFLTMYKTVVYKYHQPYLPSMFPECFTKNSQLWACNKKEETLHKSILKNNNLQILVRIYSENDTCLTVYLETVAFNMSQLYIYKDI